MHRVAPIALVLCLSAGCADPGFAVVAWDRNKDVAFPEARAPRSPGGALVVTTDFTLCGDEFSSERRGYAVFDDAGRRVFRCAGYDGDRDRIVLEPGRYVVVSLVDSGVLTRGLEVLQVLVQDGAVTRVDFTRPRPAPVVPAPVARQDA